MYLLLLGCGSHGCFPTSDFDSYYGDPSSTSPMACSLLPLRAPISSRPAPRTLPRGPRVLRHRPPPPPPPRPPLRLRALPSVAAGAASGIRDALADAFLASPPTWRSAAASNLAVFVAGSPLLLSGLSASGIAAAYLLGTLAWRAFGLPGFLLVVAYFVVVSRSDRFCSARNGLVYFEFGLVAVV